MQEYDIVQKLFLYNSVAMNERGTSVNYTPATVLNNQGE